MASGSANVGSGAGVKLPVKRDPALPSFRIWVADWAVIEPGPDRNAFTAKGAAASVVCAAPVSAWVRTRARSAA